MPARPAAHTVAEFCYLTSARAFRRGIILTSALPSLRLASDTVRAVEAIWGHEADPVAYTGLPLEVCCTWPVDLHSFRPASALALTPPLNECIVRLLWGPESPPKLTTPNGEPRAHAHQACVALLYIHIVLYWSGTSSDNLLTHTSCRKSHPASCARDTGARQATR